MPQPGLSRREHCPEWGAHARSEVLTWKHSLQPQVHRAATLPLSLLAQRRLGREGSPCGVWGNSSLLLLLDTSEAHCQSSQPSDAAVHSQVLAHRLPCRSLEHPRVWRWGRVFFLGKNTVLLGIDPTTTGLRNLYDTWAQMGQEGQGLLPERDSHGTRAEDFWGQVKSRILHP